MNITDEEIFDILDGIASEELLQRHERLLQEDEEYQLLFKEYAATHALLEDLPMEKTAVNFTDKLIDQWELAQEPEVVLKPKSHLHLYFLAVMCALIVLVVALSSGMPSVQSVKVPLDFSVLTNMIHQKELINFMLIANALLAVFILDKKVFKPYFRM
ncbi:hypothetical protein [Flectobacillus longus]|uniref:hypothetical protein n=1 Tax=Flectobacillus longus TaxID=2984207 RepID=UPI0024B78A32|nr:hypothetical protein [Flectobacillus longus]MDI9881443.1 hypothetical protein [Flectobacillus longus]